MPISAPCLRKKMSIKSVRLNSAPTISNIAGMHGAKEDHPSMLPLPFPWHVTVKCIPSELVHCLTCQPSKKRVDFTHSFSPKWQKKAGPTQRRIQKYTLDCLHRPWADYVEARFLCQRIVLKHFLGVAIRYVACKSDCNLHINSGKQWYWTTQSTLYKSFCLKGRAMK